MFERTYKWTHETGLQLKIHQNLPTHFRIQLRSQALLYLVIKVFISVTIGLLPLKTLSSRPPPYPLPSLAKIFYSDHNCLRHILAYNFLPIFLGKSGRHRIPNKQVNIFNKLSNWMGQALLIPHSLTALSKITFSVFSVLFFFFFWARISLCSPAWPMNS